MEGHVHSFSHQKESINLDSSVVVEKVDRIAIRGPCLHGHAGCGNHLAPVIQPAYEGCEMSKRERGAVDWGYQKRNHSLQDFQ